MSNNWYMLTLIGEDKPGIVASVSKALFEHGLNLGETSMLRLGGNFTIMMMVSGVHGEADLRDRLKPVIEALGMCLHVDPIQAHLHEHLLPNIQVTVSGADRAGIVAQVTAALAAAGFNILDLESDVAGTQQKPVYIMQIAGVAEVPVEAIERALEPLRLDGVDVNVNAVETYIG
ncbi:MAG: ACT domain-containing protein [Chromatiaceae bacterium]|jgi:glycine cleavage system transcriptional repressor|nr:ACT domain-containing protein [Chromatiaceae bacterium]